MRLFVFLALFLPALASAQTCLCCKKRDAGQTAYNSGDYQTALTRWQEGLKLSDAANCPDLPGLVAKAQKKIADQKSAAARQREQDGAAQRRRDQEAARQAQARQTETDQLRRQADDDLWEVLRDGDIEASNKYLKKYPSGRHAAEARQRVKDLTPQAAAKMVLVKGGNFTMGDLLGEGDTDEKPLHSVTVSDFYLGKYELTVREYLAFANETKSRYPEWLEAGSQYNINTGTDDHYKKLGTALREENNPIVGISWDDAVAYCAWLSARNGGQYRLPTEAEWEYAARGGQQSKGYTYSGSNTLDEVGWYSSNAGGKTHAVGGRKANELGLFDMSGNVWEWCGDWYGTYPAGAQTNPTGPAKGDYRVYRGGGWHNDPRGCRAANRSDDPPTNRAYYLGFRLARSF